MWLFTLARNERARRQNDEGQCMWHTREEYVCLTRWEKETERRKQRKRERMRIKGNYTLNLQCCTFKLAVPFNSMLFECFQEFPLQSEERASERESVSRSQGICVTNTKTRIKWNCLHPFAHSNERVVYSGIPWALCICILRILYNVPPLPHSILKRFSLCMCVLVLVRVSGVNFNSFTFFTSSNFPGFERNLMRCDWGKEVEKENHAFILVQLNTFAQQQRTQFTAANSNLPVYLLWFEANWTEPMHANWILCLS